MPTFSNPTYQRSPIDLAKERLIMVDLLDNLIVQVAGHNHMLPCPVNGWDHKSRLVEGLQIYLSLTCFDILGKTLGRTSVRKCFFGFIDDLPKSEQDKLVDSVAILDITRPNADPNISNGVDKEVTDRETKKEFIFQVRNSYTHEGISTGTLLHAFRGVFPTLSLEESKEWVPIQYKPTNGLLEYREYRTRSWPTVITQIIRKEIERREALLPKVTGIQP